MGTQKRSLLVSLLLLSMATPGCHSSLGSGKSLGAGEAVTPIGPLPKLEAPSQKKVELGRKLFFDGLNKAGHITMTSASVKTVAMVMPVTKPGVTFMYFLDTRESANSLVPRVVDPLVNNYRFKLASGKVRKIGESEYKKSFDKMTFKSRAII